LPTETEWEYAARAGSPQSRSGDSDQSAWFNSNSGGKTHPVATKQPNEWKLHDMLGNVWEWVGDWYDAKYYQSGNYRNPQGPLGSQFRAMRGGSWESSPRVVRFSTRSGLAPAIRNARFGCRCVWELP
jgi:formylglycine-generating enzyme required for sulfatase activity